MTLTSTYSLPMPWALPFEKEIKNFFCYVKTCFSSSKEQVSSAIIEKESAIIEKDSTEIIKAFNSGIKDFLIEYTSNPDKIKNFKNLSSFLYAKAGITPENLHALCFKKNKVTPDLNLDSITIEEPIEDYNISRLVQIGTELNELTRYLSKNSSSLFNYFRDKRDIPLKVLSEVFFGGNMWNLEPSKN